MPNTSHSYYLHCNKQLQLYFN